MDRYCKNYYSLNIDTFLKNIQYVQSWTKDWMQIHKIKQNRFSYGMCYS